MTAAAVPPSTTNGTSSTPPLSLMSSKLEEAKKEKLAGNSDAAISLLRDIILSPDKFITSSKASSQQVAGDVPSAAAAATTTDEDPTRVQELAIYTLAEVYAECCKASELHHLLLDCRPFFGSLPKARTAKVVRTLIDYVSKIPNSGDLLLGLCMECIEWCRQEKRTFLRHRVETRLALLYLQQGKLQSGLQLVGELLREVKKLDDKLLLVEIHLTESKLYWTVRNLAKSKAALTAARTNANAIHCPPLLQGDIDLQGGILHAQENDFKTAFSYFFEAFEAFSSSTTTSRIGGGASSSCTEDPRALQSLKYLMLAKIMCGSPEEIAPILGGKHGLKYVGHPDMDALRSIAKCHKERSLSMFETTLEQHREQLYSDPVLKHHIDDLYETLLEQNLLRILEPFSRVEVDHVAKLIDLPLVRIQRKLGQMVLDGKLQGTLDQGIGVLILFDQPALPETYEDCLTTLKNMSDVVETLYEKAHLVV
eukprot:GHVQ01029804.1.p1 GENE.GHVQ01029804.1~~GHVQ01029804.1.p1  ORF type:complete len:481 (+),score=81.05 GHVQ01029804.1:354-1796(+)